jgi:hypothetical protein
MNEIIEYFALMREDYVAVTCGNDWRDTRPDIVALSAKVFADKNLASVESMERFMRTYGRQIHGEKLANELGCVATAQADYLVRIQRAIERGQI